MKLHDENNSVSKELPVENEYGVAAENAAALQEIPVENEFAAEEEFESARSDVRQVKRTSAKTVLSGIAASVAAVVASVIVGITNLINVSMQAEITDFVFSDSQLVYQISVSDWTEKENLSLYVYDNEQLMSTIPLVRPQEGEVLSGAIALDKDEIAERLAATDNVTLSYRVSLIGEVGLNVERLFDSYVLEIDKLTSVFSGEIKDLQCTCSKDSRVHFRLDEFVDDHGYFTDFQAYIIDAAGNRFDCVFTEDLHGDQSIFIANAVGAKATFYFSYKNQGETQLFSTEMAI